MKKVWVVIVVDISGGTISTIVCEDGWLFVFSDGLRQGALERTVITI